MKTFVKDPDANLDYGFDWELWLDGDTISTSNWTVESPLVATLESSSNTITGLFIAGGDHGSDYLVTNRITTNGGLTDDRSFQLKIRNR
jgi:hypothetical protein